ncbi:hypothetical protein G6F70_001272 [Rhizopus microsporus]|nr:hypothetical protein G6F71_000278 [Rhizopus microsporus]KAG1203547.1 hypothetical protein G6F70_001272 [Rhizopus microsporus]KAG1215204.1 hypothetical protein G6F69_001210 [Rhizopus microsporus]KAG1237810.1 hypothetical protein G6F67_000903 [Rhizopus microsporus]KAG1268930.1 hypothetical protein G6F68_000710 [Rhizopus microsporus]
MSLKNKILVTSKQNGQSLQFVKDLFKESNSPFPDSLIDKRLEETKGDITGISIPYKIDTKYYTANVTLWIDEVDQQETAKVYSQKEEVTKAVDCFVFVMKETEHFESIKMWLPFLEQAEPNIRMCINYGSTKEEEAAEMNDWCLSHAFDYVDMNEVKSDVQFDKVGIELALDIIQTNLWEGMVKKKKKKMTEQEEEQDLIREIQELQLYKEEEEEDMDLPSQSEIMEMQSKLFGSIDEEDGLDKTFQMLQSMREHGKTLSDQERRKMAAQVALSFAAQLGL